MTYVIEVGPPDTSGVRPGTLWRTRAHWEVLVLWPITAEVFNIIMWPEGEDMNHPDAAGSMIAADVLALGSECIAEPLPTLLSAIELARGG